MLFFFRVLRNLDLEDDLCVTREIWKWKKVDDEYKQHNEVALVFLLFFRLLILLLIQFT